VEEATMHDPGLERTFSQVLDAGYDIARQHFRALFSLALLGSVPMLLFVAVSTPGEGANPSALEAGLLVAGLLLSVGFLLYLYAALTHAVCGVALGAELDVSRSLQAARAAFPRVLWSGIVATLAMLLGLLCLVLPGLYLGLIMQLTILPICVLEGTSGLAAIRRAHGVMQGSLLSGIGVAIVVAIASAVLSGFAGLAEGQGPLVALPALLLATGLSTLLQVSVYSVFFLSARARRQALDGPATNAPPTAPAPWDRTP